MPEPRLHLDADTSSKALQTALSAPLSSWHAATPGTAASSWPPKSVGLSSLIAALDRLLSETLADDWIGQVRWLNQWRVVGGGLVSTS